MICKLLDSLDKKICINCSKIVKQCTEKGLCVNCDEKTPIAGKITRNLTAKQRENSTAELISIQETTFLLRRAVPRKLYTLWSDILTDIALGMADATNESDARKALKRYLKLKSVLIKPVRGGCGYRNRNINLTEKLMISCYKGNEEEVWQTALEIEKSRQRKRAEQKSKKKRNLGGARIERTSRKDEVKRRSDRVKILTNDGELRKAFATMVQPGVAPSTDDIVTQLTRKFPPRRNKVSWPNKDRIDT